MTVPLGYSGAPDIFMLSLSPVSVIISSPVTDPPIPLRYRYHAVTGSAPPHSAGPAQRQVPGRRDRKATGRDRQRAKGPRLWLPGTSAGVPGPDPDAVRPGRAGSRPCG